MAQAGAPFFGARVIALRRERVSRESVLGGTVRGSLAPHGAVVVAHRDGEHLPQTSNKVQCGGVRLQCQATV